MELSAVESLHCFVETQDFFVQSEFKKYFYFEQISAWLYFMDFCKQKQYSPFFHFVVVIYWAKILQHKTKCSNVVLYGRSCGWLGSSKWQLICSHLRETEKDQLSTFTWTNASVKSRELDGLGVRSNCKHANESECQRGRPCTMPFTSRLSLWRHYTCSTVPLKELQKRFAMMLRIFPGYWAILKCQNIFLIL